MAGIQCGSFSDRFACFLWRFFSFFGVVDVVIIVFDVIAVIVVEVAPPTAPRRQKESRVAFFISAGGRSKNIRYCHHLVFAEAEYYHLSLMIMELTPNID